MTRVFPPLIILGILAALATFVFYALVPAPTEITRIPVGQPFTDHGFKTHDIENTFSKECSLNPMKVMWNKDEGKFVDICKDSRGFWAIFIYKIVDGFKREVTAYERPQATSMSDVVDYVKGNGFSRNPPPMP